MQLEWFSYDLEMKTCKQNRNNKRMEIFVCRTDTNVHGFWLVKRTLGWKNFKLEELSRNELILRFDIILQHDRPIKQCLLHIRVFFGGKTKRSCFDLFIHWLIKRITNTCKKKTFFRGHMKIALIRCAVNRLLCFTEMQRIKGKRNSKRRLRSSLGLEEPKLELTLGTYENKTLVQLILTLTLL